MFQKLIHSHKFKPTIIGFFINHNFLVRSNLYKHIVRHSNQLSGKLLDFGCGTKPYKSVFKNIESYTGVDYEIKDRDQSELNYDVLYDGHTIPFENNYFDSILCTEVLEHVFNIDRVLSEFYRVLKPHGKILITAPFFWEEHEVPHDFARYTYYGLHHLLEKHGFEVIKSQKSGTEVEVILESILLFIKKTLPKNKIIRQLLLLPFIAPTNFFAKIFSFLLPSSGTVYFSTVFLAQKPTESAR